MEGGVVKMWIWHCFASIEQKQLMKVDKLCRISHVVQQLFFLAQPKQKQCQADRDQGSTLPMVPEIANNLMHKLTTS